MRFSIVVAIIGLAAAATPSVFPTLAAADVIKENSNGVALLREYDTALKNKRFNDALKIANGLPTPRDDSELSALVFAMRASALLGLRRERDAQRMIDRSVALNSKEPFPDNVILWGGIRSKNYPVMLAAFDRMIARYPDAVREMSPDLVRFVANKARPEDKKGDDDRRLALGRLHYGSEISPDMFAFPAMRVLIDRGDVAGAASLLPSIRSVDSLQLMMVMRRYQPLWPMIAERVGLHFEKARAAEVEFTHRLFVDKPGEAKRLKAYVNALVSSGELDRAIALRSKLPMSKAGMAGIDEDRAWAINHIAAAMSRNGQAEEADQLFEMLNDSTTKSNWRVNMFINRLGQVVNRGNFDKAEQLLEITDHVARTEGSDFARQLMRKMRFCIKSRLGKTAEAQAARTAMLEHAEDAKFSTVEALMCVGDYDAAEALARTFADDHDFKNDLVETLQARPLPDSDIPVWQENWLVLRKRPYVRQLFDKLGRDMPDDFYFAVGKQAKE